MTFHKALDNTQKRCINDICTPFTATCLTGPAEPAPSIAWVLTAANPEDGSINNDVVIQDSDTRWLCDTDVCSAKSVIHIYKADVDTPNENKKIQKSVFVNSLTEYSLECVVTQTFPGRTGSVTHTKEGGL